MVELALASTLLFTILFGIIEFGQVFNNSINIRQGTREGARQAIVASFGSCSGVTLTGAGAVPQETQNLMCLVHSRVGISGTQLRTAVVLDTSLSTPYSVGNPVVVCTQLPIQSITGLFAPFLGGKFLKTKAEMRIEETSATSGASRFAAGSETAPSGSDWSWCAP
jgi:Flp pilus assembly protein TadG